MSSDEETELSATVLEEHCISRSSSWHEEQLQPLTGPQCPSQQLQVNTFMPQ